MHNLFAPTHPYTNLRARANHIMHLHQDHRHTERDEAARQLAADLLRATGNLPPIFPHPRTADPQARGTMPQLPPCALPISPRYLTTATGN